MISVIVPIYNVEAYLNRCVNSIVNQTYKDLEIILVDDGSPDQCNKLCDEWARKDCRIKVIHKENGGLSSARNAGIEESCGEYLGFVDGDDWIEPDMYKDLYNALIRSKAELAVTGIKRTYDNGYSRNQYVWDKPYVLEGDKIVQSYLRQGTFSTSAGDKLYLKSLFNRRRFPVGKLYEDAPVIFDILCEIEKLAVVGKPQYNYFQRSDSICGKEFSERKMDHYEFSREIWARTKREYPQYTNDADVFFGCKICEILYNLYESNNQKEFQKERVKLYGELKAYWIKIVFSSNVPLLIKIKVCLARFHLIHIYNKLKQLKATRANIGGDVNNK